MSLFQRSFYGEDPSFTNLFRMLDDFASYSNSREAQAPQGARAVRQRLFNPRFDVRETETAFELHGELPGVDREHLTIEFVEPQTLAIRGRVERNYSAGNPPAAAAIEDTQVSGAVTEGSEASHQASVSDEETETAKEKGEVAPVAAPAKSQPSPPKERYWHQERQVGEFYRTFNFHSRVDEAAVSANLDRGVLHVTIPKAAKHETRRVNIN
jgi:HSP20 family molecular chaperone IbpA